MIAYFKCFVVQLDICSFGSKCDRFTKENNLIREQLDSNVMGKIVDSWWSTSPQAENNH